MKRTPVIDRRLDALLLQMDPERVTLLSEDAERVDGAVPACGSREEPQPCDLPKRGVVGFAVAARTAIHSSTCGSFTLSAAA